MDDSLVVDGGQALRELEQHPPAALRGQGSDGQCLEQRLPLGELHHQAGRVVRLAEVDDPDHCRVLDAGEQARLALEALAHPGLLAHLAAQDLEGHPPAKADLLGEVHLPHAATSEVTQHAEAIAQDQGVRLEHGSDRTLAAVRRSLHCRPRAYPLGARPEVPGIWGAWSRVVP